MYSFEQINDNPYMYYFQLKNIYFGNFSIDFFKTSILIVIN